jgi:hypothetical protein
MALSNVKIANSALIKVGANRIDALTDDNDRAAIINEQFDELRDELLRSHPWNFAIQRKSVAQTADTPVFGFTYEYQIPSDSLRILSTNIPQDVDYQIELNKNGTSLVIVTDYSEVKIRYIKRQTDPTLFSHHFAQTLALRIAYDVSYFFNQSTAQRNQLWQEYQAMLAQARSFDAQEGRMPTVEADDWIDVRF